MIRKVLAGVALVVAILAGGSATALSATVSDQRASVAHSVMVSFSSPHTVKREPVASLRLATCSNRVGVIHCGARLELRRGHYTRLGDLKLGEFLAAGGHVCGTRLNPHCPNPKTFHIPLKCDTFANRTMSYECGVMRRHGTPWQYVGSFNGFQGCRYLAGYKILFRCLEGDEFV